MNSFHKKIIYLIGVITFSCFCNRIAAQDTLSKYILTPKQSPSPKINGPKIFAVRPGHPILFRVPATGTRPMEFSAKNLPAGVKLDSKTGQLSGSINKE